MRRRLVLFFILFLSVANAGAAQGSARSAPALPSPRASAARRAADSHKAAPKDGPSSDETRPAEAGMDRSGGARSSAVRPPAESRAAVAAPVLARGPAMRKDADKKAVQSREAMSSGTITTITETSSLPSGAAGLPAWTASALHEVAARIKSMGLNANDALALIGMIADDHRFADIRGGSYAPAAKSIARVAPAQVSEIAREIPEKDALAADEAAAAATKKEQENFCPSATRDAIIACIKKKGGSKYPYVPNPPAVLSQVIKDCTDDLERCGIEGGYFYKDGIGDVLCHMSVPVLLRDNKRREWSCATVEHANTAAFEKIPVSEEEDFCPQETRGLIIACIKNTGGYQYAINPPRNLTQLIENCKSDLGRCGIDGAYFYKDGIGDALCHMSTPVLVRRGNDNVWLCRNLSDAASNSALFSASKK